MALVQAVYNVLGIVDELLGGNIHVVCRIGVIECELVVGYQEERLGRRYSRWLSIQVDYT